MAADGKRETQLALAQPAPSGPDDLHGSHGQAGHRITPRGTDALCPGFGRPSPTVEPTLQLLGGVQGKACSGTHQTRRAGPRATVWQQFWSAGRVDADAKARFAFREHGDERIKLNLGGIEDGLVNSGVVHYDVPEPTRSACASSRARAAVHPIEPQEVLVAVFNGVFPVLPGKEDAARAFANEVSGPRLEQFKAQEAKANITKELWTLQQTPMGSLLVVWFEGNVEKAFADLATDDGEFATWFRAQALAISGVDLSAPPAGPAPEAVLDWTA